MKRDKKRKNMLKSCKKCKEKKTNVKKWQKNKYKCNQVKKSKQEQMIQKNKNIDNRKILLYLKLKQKSKKYYYRRSSLLFGKGF